jgi:hypothetical protein
MASRISLAEAAIGFILFLLCMEKASSARISLTSAMAIVMVLPLTLRGTAL